MKVTCDSCQQRYQIPDEKCQGKVLRVRCSRCQYVMKVVGPTRAFQEDMRRPPTLTNAKAYRAMNAPQTEKPIWWCGIQGKRHGPYTKREVQKLAERGDINGRTYMWCKGMAGWARICESPGLAFALEMVLDAAMNQPVPDVFEQVPILGDGHGYFADPTMKSGFLILDARTQAHLETIARDIEAREKPVPPKKSSAPAIFVAASGLAFGVMGVLLMSHETLARIAGA